MKNHNKAFGKVLREFRKAKNQSQEDLAFEATLDRTYISLLELGQRSPTLDTITSLCNALNISLVELIAAVETRMDQSHD